jgi:hypothetical protein
MWYYKHFTKSNHVTFWKVGLCFIRTLEAILVRALSTSAKTKETYIWINSTHIVQVTQKETFQ